MEIGTQSWSGTGSENPQHLPPPQDSHQQSPHPRGKKKLRESCNHCALSKIRCSKDQPYCVRCSERGLCCHYAPSRRTGKRRGWSTASSAGTNSRRLTSETVLPPAETLPQVSLAQGPTPNSFDFVQKPSPDLTQATPCSNQLCLDLQPMAYSTGGSTMTLRDGISSPMNVNIEDVDDTAGLSEDQQSTAYASIDMLNDHRSNLNLYATDFEELNSILGISAQPDNPGAVTPCSNSHSSNQSSSGHPNTQLLEQPQDCMSRALNILNNLHMAPSTCISTSSGCPNPKEAPRIDHVLTTNKEVIDSIDSILGCSCSLDLQLVLVLTVITSKVISWYSAVVRCDDNPRRNGSSASGSGSLATAERVLHQPISVGKYHLDGDDMGKTRAQLVLSELHRVVGLVKHIAKCFVGLGLESSSAQGISNGPKFTSMIGMELEAFLRGRLKAMTKEAVDVLREA